VATKIKIHVNLDVDAKALAKAMQKAVDRSRMSMSQMAEAFRYAAVAGSVAGVNLRESIKAVQALTGEGVASPKLRLTKADVERMKYELVRTIRFRRQKKW